MNEQDRNACASERNKKTLEFCSNKQVSAWTAEQQKKHMAPNTRGLSGMSFSSSFVQFFYKIKREVKFSYFSSR